MEKNTNEQLKNSVESTPENLLDKGINTAQQQASALEARYDLKNVAGDLHTYIKDILDMEQAKVTEDTRSALADLQQSLDA